MTATGSDVLPRPPSDPPAGWQPYLRERVEVWRLHWEAPEEIATRPAAEPPRYRFDDPSSEYAVTYGNSEEVGAFLEVYGDTQTIPTGQRVRRRTELATTRELLLVDADRATTQKVFALDAGIATTRDYDSTRAWGRAWHDWYPKADGIRYRSRHENDTLNVCFFLDRCADALTLGVSVRLDEIDRGHLLRLVTPYRISVGW